MIERKSGVILHISSIQHSLPLFDATLAYAAAKGALSTYNKGLANEVGPKGVRVNMISPGFIETSGAHGMIVQLAQSSGTSEDAARQQIMNMIGGIPIGRPGHPEEVAELVAFLASARAAHFVILQLLLSILKVSILTAVTLDWHSEPPMPRQDSLCPSRVRIPSAFTAQYDAPSSQTVKKS